MVKLICTDCNGVLEHIDHDYSISGYYKGNTEIIDKINNLIFGSRYLLKTWNINEITTEELNKIFSHKFNISETFLNELLIQNIKDFSWNWDLINLFQIYRGQGIKVIMTTNNIDLFTEIAIPYNNFNNYFDKIYNSADLMCLKEDNDFELYKKISMEYGLNKSEILVIDDNNYIIEKLSKYGFGTYLYNKETYNKFEIWFEKNCK